MGTGFETPSPPVQEPEPSQRRYVRPRTYRQLVTLEAEPDEDLVYGDATPAIVEWRMVRAEFLKTLKTGTVLDRAEAEQPMLRLEITIIEEHELTLPPGVLSLGRVRPAGSGLGADAASQAGSGGSEPGAAASVAAPRLYLWTVAELMRGCWCLHGSAVTDCVAVTQNLGLAVLELRHL